MTRNSAQSYNIAALKDNDTDDDVKQYIYAASKQSETLIDVTVLFIESK